MKIKILLLVLLPTISFSQTINSPTISKESGFYNDDFKIAISHEESSVQILYTLDGSSPTYENLSGKVWNYKIDYPRNPGDALGDLLSDTSWTYLYNDSLLVYNRTTDINKFAQITTSIVGDGATYLPFGELFKSTTLRAVAYKNGEYSEIVTKNYFVSPEGENRYQFPVISINIDPENLYGYENGINVPGKEFDSWRQQNPSLPYDGFTPANFQIRGDEGEYEIHFSYFKNGFPILEHNAGIRINGGYTRAYPNKSFRLYAKSGYGEKNFKTGFFDNYSYSKFKRLVLRNSGNDSRMLVFRDALTHQLTKNMNYAIQESSPAVVFVNSEYNGIRNIRERYDKKFFERVYGIDEDSLDYFKNWDEIKEGDMQFLLQTLDFFENNSLEDNETYNEAIKYIDPINYTDVLITNIYVANTDWPKNNSPFWRKKVNYNPQSEEGNDGRFRWLLKDTDWGFDLYNDGNKHEFDMLEYLTKSYDSSSDSLSYIATLLFKGLLKNNDYKTYFINRLADVLNTTLKQERILEFIEQFENKYLPEIEENGRRWSGFTPNLNNWNDNLETMRYFVENRHDAIREHVNSNFDINGTYPLLVNVSDENHGHIHLNSIDILPSTDGINEHPYIWEGIYFNEVPITLTAVPNPGYKFSHWSGMLNDSSSIITINPTYETYLRANFVPDYSDLETETKNKEKIKIFPNPFSDKIQILLENYPTNYRVYSLEGRMIATGVLTSPTLDLSEITRGIYTLEIQQKDNVFTQKIIKK